MLSRDATAEAIFSPIAGTHSETWAELRGASFDKSPNPKADSCLIILFIFLENSLLFSTPSSDHNASLQPALPKPNLS